MIFSLGHVAEVFDEVHYICTVVHGILDHWCKQDCLDSSKHFQDVDLHTRSNCSRMHECKSSSMSRYLRA